MGNSYFPTMRRVKSIHFIGIGGSGMNGIAEVLLRQGYKVSGCDTQENSATQRLRELGADIHKGHSVDHIKDVDVVVVSSVIDHNSPEVAAAHLARIPVLPRAQMLAEIMRFHSGIAIAGTHGKTTTTSLVASILAEGGLDPTFVIGGMLNSAGANARLGDSEYFVVEADESDASFLYFNPSISVVTNIDADHMQTYGNDFSRLKQTFIDFLHRLPFYGVAILCVDNPVVKEIMPDISRPIITYGFAEIADVQAEDFQQNGFVTTFTVHVRSQNITFPVTLNLPGKHSVQNSLAAIAVALECGVNPAAICRALAQFKGVGRRMQQYGELQLPNQTKVLLIDDYGHHPREISVTVQAVRAALPGRRLVLAFQPHRYTRTQALFEDFVSALSEVDVLLLMEVYAASEQPIAGADSRALARSIRQRGQVEPIFVENNDELFSVLPSIVKDGDVLLIEGAGNIGGMVQRLVAAYK